MGRDRKNEQQLEHWTQMIRSTMETPAWRALSTTAQALYPWLKLEWKGTKFNNNGKISLPVRVAGERLGCNMKTAARAFHDLQAKGFLLLINHGRLGVEGKGAPPTFEITELATPGEQSGKKLFLRWREGQDFPVCAHSPVNPKGHNGLLPAKRINIFPSPETERGVPKNGTRN